ncbi:MAG: MFS transporter [Chloroflexi bacterium]|nr:MFS transporter [Chloroflexota bacterium]
MKLKRLHYSWVIVIVSGGIAFVSSILEFTFGVYLKPLAAEFNSGRAVISGARSLNGVLSGLMGIGIGSLNDRYGPRILATMNGVLAGVGLILMSRVGEVWQIYIFYGVLLAIARSCFQIPTYSTIPRWFTSKRVLALGIIQAAFGLGGVIITPLVQWLITTYGWRPSYLVLGLVSLAVITPLAQFMKHNPQQIGTSPYGEEATSTTHSDPASDSSSGLPLTKAAKTSGFWLFGLILFSFWFGLGVVTTHIVPYATDIGIPPGIAATVISVFTGSGIIGKLSVGAISDKIGIRLTLTVSLVLVALSFLWLLLAKEIWMLYVFAIVFGIGYGAVITLPAGVSTHLFGLKYLSTIFASLQSFGNVGMALGPIIAGTLYDVMGNYTTAFLICAGFGALSVALSLVLLRYKTPAGGHA